MWMSQRNILCMVVVHYTFSKISTDEMLQQICIREQWWDIITNSQQLQSLCGLWLFIYIYDHTPNIMYVHTPIPTSSVKASKHLLMSWGFTGQFIINVQSFLPIKSGSHNIGEKLQKVRINTNHSLTLSCTNVL
jgi:hypothetical protein